MNLNLGGFPPKPSRKYFPFLVKYENVWFANLSSSLDMCQPWQKAAVPLSDEKSVKRRAVRVTPDSVHTRKFASVCWSFPSILLKYLMMLSKYDPWYKTSIILPAAWIFRGSKIENCTSLHSLIGWQMPGVALIGRLWCLLIDSLVFGLRDDLGKCSLITV